MIHTIKLFILLFFVSKGLIAQKRPTIEVLLIGTAHNYDTTINHHFSSEKNAVLNFKPDIICVETLKPTDTVSIRNWNGDRPFTRAAILQERNAMVRHTIPPMTELYKKLQQNELDYKTRIQLIYRLVVGLDEGNQQYHAFLLQKAINENKLSENDYLYLQQVLCRRDSLKFYMHRKDSEFNNIIFPLADELGMVKVYPMDSHKHDRVWVMVGQRYSVALKNVLNDTIDEKLSNFRDEYKHLLQKYEQIRAQRIQQTKDGHLLRFVNTASFDSLAFFNEFSDPKLHGYAVFPKEAMQEKMHVWNMRNKEMCDNIIDAAMQTNSKKIVVFVGAGHRQYFAVYFKEKGFIKLTDLESLLNQ